MSRESNIKSGVGELVSGDSALAQNSSRTPAPRPGLISGGARSRGEKPAAEDADGSGAVPAGARSFEGRVSGSGPSTAIANARPSGMAGAPAPATGAGPASSLKARRGSTAMGSAETPAVAGVRRTTGNGAPSVHDGKALEPGTGPRSRRAKDTEGGSSVPGSALAMNHERGRPAPMRGGPTPRSPDRGLYGGALQPSSAAGLLRPRTLKSQVEEPAAPPVYANRKKSARVQALKKAGGSAESEAAVLAGLRYLASRQRETGAWGARARDRKYGDVRVGKTGLAILAFLGSDYTHKRQNQFQKVVSKGIAFLVEQQDRRSGHLGDTAAYSHGIGTYALAEAYAMTRDENLRRPLERAVRRILRAQTTRRGSRLDGGWSYFYRDEDRRYDSWPRLSVTVWQIMALESARIGGLEVDDSVLARARSFVLGSHDRNLRAFRYNHDPEWLDTSFPTLPGSTSAALFAMELLGVDRTDPRQKTALRYVMDRIPDYSWRKSSLNRFVSRGHANEYFLYYATLGMRLRGGPDWDRWNRSLQNLLLPSQDRDGSWKPVSHYLQYVRDTNKDRSYTTAMCVLMLEVYYRYDTPLLQAMARALPKETTPSQEPAPPQPDPLSGTHLHVESVDSGSSAEDAGLMAGDVIVRLGPELVSTIDDLKAAIRRQSFSSGSNLTIRRGSSTRTLTVEGALQGLVIEERDH